jgi:class 3 adenylate cyclase
MSPGSLYLVDPVSSRFVAGGLPEAETLLGSPLPLLPPPETERGQPVFLIKCHPQLRSLAQRTIQGLLAQIGLDLPRAAPARPTVEAKDQAEYETTLTHALRSARTSDRRLGLTNLFWLAHTKEVADIVHELEARTPAMRKLKYSLHPLLSSFYRRIEHSVRRDVARMDPERQAVLTGSKDNLALIDALLEDGFAFNETSILDVDFNQFLAANKRYRLGADLFFEIFSLLTRETERRLREGDRALLSLIARHMPGLTKEHQQSQSGIIKVTLNSHVLTYLFSDAWTTGARLMASARLKAELEHRRSAEVMGTFVDLVNGVKRFEFLSRVRDLVVLMHPGDSHMEERVSKGLRLYEFGDSAQVLNNAVNATILFLDLRGFTKTSEGHISERDLTQELYTVFDAFVPSIHRFGGTVDKFLGDGMMVTFSTVHAEPLDPLNAMRTAILCQRTLDRLRREGKTYFKMGVAIHFGRAYLARFIADEDSEQITVIGRNVNLAGRLSSAAKRPIEADENYEPEPIALTGPSGMCVTVDESGALFNEGIAISRDTLAQIESRVPLTHIDEGGVTRLEYFDEAIGLKILIQYAGDAKFKGVQSSFPTYAVDYE